MGFGYRWRGGWGEEPSARPKMPPPTPGALRVAIAVDLDQGLESPLSPRFGRAPFILIVDIVGGEVKQYRCFRNPHADAPRGAGTRLGRWLLEAGVRAVVGAQPGPHLSMLLQQAGVAVYPLPPGIRAIDALRQVGLVKPWR